MIPALSLLAACSLSPPEEAPPDPPVAAEEASSVSTLPAWSSTERSARSSQHPLQETEPLLEARELLRQLVEEQASDPELPWAVGHGLLAKGADWRLSDGSLALDLLFERYAQWKEIDGERCVEFPSKVGSIRVEPHSDLMLKVLTELPVAPERLVQVEGEEAQLGQLWQCSVLQTYLSMETSASSYSSPDDMAWGVPGIAALAGEDLRWTAGGEVMHLSLLARMMTLVLYQNSQPLLRSMEASAPLQKDGRGVFSLTCGGAHMMQGVARLLAGGRLTPREASWAAELVRLHRWRLDAEQDFYDRVQEQIRQGLVKAPSQPPAEDRLALQRLKFLGHWLETAQLLSALGLLESAEPSLQRGADALAALVLELQERGLLQSAESLRELDEQLFLDLVGDSAHALHGLELGLGQQSVY